MVNTFSLTKSPEIIINKISPENVKFKKDVDLISVHYGKPLKVIGIVYDDHDDISGITVRVSGRSIPIDMTKTGMKSTLRFRPVGYKPQYVGADAALFNRVR